MRDVDQCPVRHDREREPFGPSIETVTGTVLYVLGIATGVLGTLSVVNLGWLN